jgi:hypothetical protein
MDLFESILDLTGHLIDELPKSQNKALLNWSRVIQLTQENAAHFHTYPPISSRIQRILPFQIHSPYLDGLCFAKEAPSTDGQQDAPQDAVDKQILSVFDNFFKPWGWIEECGNHAGLKRHWRNEEDMKLLNDTPISLHVFEAKRIKPQTMMIERMLQQGWEPPIPAKRDLPAEPFKLESEPHTGDKRYAQDIHEQQKRQRI